MPLIDDYSLVLFAPLNEPSGAPYFKNVAERGVNSRTSRNLHVHIIDGAAPTTEAMSAWPGTAAEFNLGSGVTYRGYKAQGTSTLVSATHLGPHEKALILGPGGADSRSLMNPPSTAGSGFTVGMWVIPRSDGGMDLLSESSVPELLAEHHSLIYRGDTNDGIMMGVSGYLDNATPGGFVEDYGLQGFVFVKGTTSAIRAHVTTPMESGRFTHLTMVYEYVDGTNNTISFYKDGILEGSDTTSAELGQALLGFNDRVWTIGGTDPTTGGADYYDSVTGWGHIVSGVYGFERPLSAAEILEMHNEGGLNAGATPPAGDAVEITDPSLIMYVPGISPGLIDASKNHFNLLCDRDEGVLDILRICPGPFNRAMAMNDTSSDIAALTAGSGVARQMMAGNGSFSIGGWFTPLGSTTFDTDTFFSLGSISTGEITGTSFRSEAGFHVSGSGISPARYIARVFNNGIGDQENTASLVANDTDKWTEIARHVALVYDEQTRGIAFYMDAKLASSGTMTSPFGAVVQNLLGSGYPIVFMNGVISTTPDAFDTSAGNDCAASEMFIFNRPLLPSEIVGVAESGIDITGTYYTEHDPRLKGYWKGTEQITNDLFFPDYAKSMAGLGIPGHMVKCWSDRVWDIATSQASSPQDALQHFTYDILSVSRGSQGGAGDVYDGPLGFTSGVFCVMGGSDGNRTNNVGGAERRTHSVNVTERYKPVAEGRDELSQASIQEYIVAFEVTPSGDIPKTPDGNLSMMNSALFDHGDPTTGDRFIAFLSTVDADAGSGVTVAFAGRDGTVQQPLISGIIPYGMPSRVAFHMKPLNPYQFTSATNNRDNHASITIYIDGQKHNTMQMASDDARVWTDQSAGGQGDWVLQIGGRAISDTFSTALATEPGLGEIHLRNISVWVGAFSDNDLHEIATSGIRASTLTGFSDGIGLTEVDIADADLKGFWRFTGRTPQSGVLDHSLGNNNLTNLVQQAQESVGGPIWGSDNASDNFRLVPGPFINSAFPNPRGSGITFGGNAPSTVRTMAPMAVSGEDFNSPDSGFTVGFWVCPRAVAPTTNRNKALMAYGPVPNATTTTTWVDASWAIFHDELESFSMYLSKYGTMYTDTAANAAKAGRVRCLISRETNEDPTTSMESFRKGAWHPGHVDAFSHIIFSYDNAAGVIKGYYNGELIDEKIVAASGFHVPLSADARMITFLSAQVDTPWNFSLIQTPQDDDSIMFEPFYFTRAITDKEARYIATRGISDITTDTVSGVVGGYMPALGQGSGTIGAYARGMEHGSGVIAGYINGVDGRDGNIGGYIVGLNPVDDGSGVVGAYTQGSDYGSGTIAGYVRGSELASGVIGGFIYAGLPGNVQFDSIFTINAISAADFDASITVAQSNDASFDAKVVVYQAEAPPTVDIIVPAVTTSGEWVPFSQYFVGQATAASGKTISSASFSFSDFGAAQPVAESGNGLFALEEDHVFQASGIYVVRFSVIDSAGLHGSAVRVIHLASGVQPIEISLSGIPDVGTAPLVTQFTQRQESVPVGISVVANFLDFDDGTSTISLNPIHSYTEPGIYRAIWLVRDSRGFIFSDSLTVGINN